jgi:hypothetical protein
MIKSKVLTDSAWKDVLAKNKDIKDNGLLKALADIKKLGDDDHDGALKILDHVQKLIVQLKKSKEVAAAPTVGKFLTELTGAADTAVRDVAKAKAEAEKTAKAEADKKAQAAAAKNTDGDEDDEEEASPELLTTKLKPLLRMVAKGETMHALLAKSGKQVVVMLSRKPIPPARRKMLADQLGGGSTKYFPGHCHVEAGATTFVLKAEVAGMSKLVKAALLAQTGLRLSKVKCRGEDGDDDDDDNDVSAVSADSEEQGAAEPEVQPSLAQLAKARVEWNAARSHAVSELARLKNILQQEYRDAGSEQAALAKALQRVDATIGAMDNELNDRLDQVASAQAAQRAAQVAAAKTALQRLIKLVSSDEILQNIDGNELAPDMVIAAPLRARLTDIAQSLQ